MPVAPEWHDLTLWFGELRLRADYGLTEWLAVDLVWSLRTEVVRFVLRDFATMAPIVPPYGGVDLHHRSETLVGPTDPRLALAATRTLGAWSFRVSAGVTLPLGSTVPNPFELGDEGKVHEHIQFGTGTLDPIAEVGVRRDGERVSVEGWLSAKASLYENGYGYRAGDQLMGGVRAASDLGLGAWRFLLGVIAYREWAERWSGLTESEGNLGRTDLLLETAITWRFTTPWSATLSVRLPLVTWAVGEQLTTSAIGELAIARSFDLLGGP